MKKTFSIFLLIFLVNCSTTNNVKEEQKPSINNIIDAIKTIQLPKI